MKTLSHKGFEYSEVALSELGQEMRFDADYWEPFYLRNEEIIKSKKCSLTKDFAPNPQYGISVAMNELGVGYSILKMDNIMEILAEDKEAKYADVSKKTFNKFKLKKYDVLFNRVNSEEFVGRTGIYLMEGEHTFASYLVRVDSGKPYTNCYLTAYLNCKYGKIALQRVKRRSVNQANINAKELGNLNIPIPNQTLQKEIQILLVEAHKQKVFSEKLFKEAESALMSELGLEKWRPKSKKFNHYGVPFEVDDTSNSVNFSEFFNVDRLDAEYWHPKYADFLRSLYKKSNVNFSPLGKLVTWVKGIEIGSQEYMDNGSIPFVRVSNLTSKGLDFTTTKYVKPETFAKLKNYQIRKGEILFSKDGTAGIAYLIREDFQGINSSGILRLRNISKLSNAYIELVLNSPIVQIQIEQKVSGALIQHLKVSEAMKFVIPEIPSAEKISQKAEYAFEKMKLSKNLLQTAVQAVEIFIDSNESKAIRFVKSKVNSLV